MHLCLEGHSYSVDNKGGVKLQGGASQYLEKGCPSRACSDVHDVNLFVNDNKWFNHSQQWAIKPFYLLKFIKKNALKHPRLRIYINASALVSLSVLYCAIGSYHVMVKFKFDGRPEQKSSCEQHSPQCSVYSVIQHHIYIRTCDLLALVGTVVSTMQLFIDPLMYRAWLYVVFFRYVGHAPLGCGACFAWLILGTLLFSCLERRQTGTNHSSFNVKPEKPKTGTYWPEHSAWQLFCF